MRGTREMNARRRRRERGPVVFWLLVAAVAVGLGTGPGAAHAQEGDETDERWDSEACLGCHDGGGFSLTFPSGEELDLEVDGDAYRAGGHAAKGVQCAHCHTTIARFPHPEVTEPDARTFSVELAKSCNRCHWREFTIRQDGSHAMLLAGLDGTRPLCTDCHDPHATRALAADHPDMQARCAECHPGPVAAGAGTIHALDPTVVEEASAPPLILFYVLILGVVIAVVALGWGLVLGAQWLRRRMRSPAPG
jgi:hypothetical protein